MPSPEISPLGFVLLLFEPNLIAPNHTRSIGHGLGRIIFVQANHDVTKMQGPGHDESKWSGNPLGIFSLPISLNPHEQCQYFLVEEWMDSPFLFCFVCDFQIPTNQIPSKFFDSYARKVLKADSHSLNVGT